MQTTYADPFLTLVQAPALHPAGMGEGHLQLQSYREGRVGGDSPSGSKMI